MSSSKSYDWALINAMFTIDYLASPNELTPSYFIGTLDEGTTSSFTQWTSSASQSISLDATNNMNYQFDTAGDYENFYFVIRIGLTTTYRGIPIHLCICGHEVISSNATSNLKFSTYINKGDNIEYYKDGEQDLYLTQMFSSSVTNCWGGTVALYDSSFVALSLTFIKYEQETDRIYVDKSKAIEGKFDVVVMTESLSGI